MFHVKQSPRCALAPLPAAHGAAERVVIVLLGLLWGGKPELVPFPHGKFFSGEILNSARMVTQRKVSFCLATRKPLCYDWLAAGFEKRRSNRGAE